MRTDGFIVGECGGKTSLEGNNSSRICCSTFSVYFLTIGLPLIGWGSDIRAAPPREDRIPCPFQKS